MNLVLLIAVVFLVCMFASGRKLSRDNDRINREFKEKAESAKRMIDEMRRIR